MTRIGIMQGRLVPPVDVKIQAFPGQRWKEEFPRAASAGLECLEWIFDRAGEGVNPLGMDEGIASILSLATQYGVTVGSVCADYFMEQPLVRATDAERCSRLETLRWLMGQCHQLGVRRIVLPFVDQSAMTTPSEAESVVDSLNRMLPAAERRGLELHLETSLAPEAFRALLEHLPSAVLKVNYDSGNSASLGYRPHEEFAAYGERIGSVHIKDRRRGGGTVPLGTGDTDFDAVFSGLKALSYAGDFTLQVARGAPGDEVAWARGNREFVERQWAAARAWTCV